MGAVQSVQDRTKKLLSICDEELKLLREIAKIATQGKIHTKNPYNQWRYGTIIDRSTKTIEKAREAKAIIQQTD